ncbi:MAG: hypothetical protein QOE70_6875 [Chthoniobacter sp.]|nr:hypothetical protein [Chthoniobacter sp.]
MPAAFHVMNKSDSSEVSIGEELVGAIRFALVAIVLALSLLPLRVALSLGSFEQIFKQMLGGRPLPMVTAWTLYARHFLVVLSLVWPGAALATLAFPRTSVTSFYFLGVAGVGAIVQFLILYTALSLGLQDIFRGMMMGGTG